MNIVQAEENLKKITTKFSKESFIFDLLGAYDFPKSTISKLKIKLKKNPKDDVIVPSKLHFVGVSKKELDAKFEKLLKDYATTKKQPRFIIVTDYLTFKAYDTKMGEKLDIDIQTLSKHPDFFLPWAGIEKKVFQGENPADVKAAEKLAKVFDLIKLDNPKSDEKFRHALNVFLTRILFCFFAEDTEIFEKGLFTNSIASHTNYDGRDLEEYLSELFEVLNTDKKKRSNKIPDYLDKFPYVNGGLFAEKFQIPKFTKKSRSALIDLGDLNWAEINPDIFGSMIQAVADPKIRENFGQHYTSAPNIMKVIEPLFLSLLNEEIEKVKTSKVKLKKLLERISSIKVFDPACGSGNFLIIAYKELRLLEMKILKLLGEIPMSGISLANFYGAEIDDFAHEVAKLSLWLAEHQMDVLFNREFGSVKPSLPLKDAGQIFCVNSSQADWNKICPRDGEIYILGNPPYVGAKKQSKEQKEDLAKVFSFTKTYKNLDYISIWFYLASKYIKDINAKFSFVTTNSLIQGDHVGLLWPCIFENELEIEFAHHEFNWGNNAKNKAGVTCVIIGVSNPILIKTKFIFDKGCKIEVKNINAYLAEENTTIVMKSKKPISSLPIMEYGNMPLEGGFLKLTPDERLELLRSYPSSKKFIKRLIGGDEFLSGTERYCIWVEDTQLDEALKIPLFKKRIQQVKEFRVNGGDVARTLVNRSHQFRYRKTAKEHLLLIPCTSSYRREYVQCGFFSKDYITHHSAQIIYDAELWLLSVLSSRMHMIWVKAVAGRLRSDYRYSNVICYNTFPFPKINQETKKTLNKEALALLACREKFNNVSVADLYDPELMPDELKSQHRKIDIIIESCFKSQPFLDDADRLAFMFKEYEKLIKENA